MIFKLIFFQRERERVERMPEENERRKIQRLKKECEKLRDKLAETTRKLKDQEKLCSTVDEKERRYSVFIFLKILHLKSQTHSLSLQHLKHTKKLNIHISHLIQTHTKTDAEIV